MNVGIIVTARMGSTRLARKHLQSVAGEPALLHLVRRIQREFQANVQNGSAYLWIATGNREHNDAFETLVVGSSLQVFYGDDENVPLRHLQAGKQLGLDALVSVDGDDIFCAPEAMRAVYDALSQGADLAKTSGLPLGMNAWGYSTATLEACLNKNVVSRLETGWGRIFDDISARTTHFECAGAAQVRATLDYPEDLSFFNQCAITIPDWAELPTARFVDAILEHRLDRVNAFLSEEYWSTFNMKVASEIASSPVDFSARLNRVIPGGAHTYSRGDDQFPANAPRILERAKGTYIWTPEGERFLDYGMALRAVSIGYSEPEINEAAIRGLEAGNSLTRASTIELAAAERLVSMIDSVDMVKFTKNGSTATSAAIKLARAYTGRDMIARCSQHPFFSFDDWFIGSTPLTKGIPADTREHTKMFAYNDIVSLERLIAEHGNQIACVILEPAATDCPATASELSGCCGNAQCTRHRHHPANYLQQVQALCRKHGVVFILDETITGFRWHMKGAQHVYGVTPDLCTFGKAMANGFSVAAVAGRRDIMELGSIDKPGQERVFLLSTTHGAEMSGLAAFIATMDFMEAHSVIDHLWRYGAAVRSAINGETLRLGIDKHFFAAGPAVSPYYATVTAEGAPWFELRTLFSQEMIKQGVLMPWLAFSYRHGETEFAKTQEALAHALGVCARAIDEGVDKYLVGPAIKPVFRRYN